MEKRRLGKTDYMISKIGLGTVQFGIDYGFTKRKSQDEVNEILSSAVKYDINFIDTAREYGDSEKKIGEFTSQNRNNLIIATKLKKIPKKEKMSFEYLKDMVYSSVESSLKDLRLQKVDVLQLHQTDDYLITNPRFWLVLEELKRENLIGSFGVSVYELDETQYLAENFSNLIDFFQVPYNIFDRRFATLEEILNQRSIGLISRSTFLKGIIPCSLNNVPTGLQELRPYKIKLNNLADKLSISVEELALLFVYYNDFIASTILGVDSPEELETNVKVIEGSKNINLKYDEISDLLVEDLNLIDPRKWSDF